MQIDDSLAAYLSNELKIPFEDIVNVIESYRDNGNVRLCPPNKAKIQRNTQKSYNACDKNKATIVLNYGPRKVSIALLGDFKVKYVKYKDEFLNPTSWIKFIRLAIGPGWLAKNERLDELKKSLKKFNISWEEIDYNDFIEHNKDFNKEESKETMKKSKKEESSDSEEEPKKKKKTKGAVKKSKKEESSDSEEETQEKEEN